MQIYTPQQRLALHIALILLLGGAILYGLMAYIPALIGSIILYVLFRKMNFFLNTRRGWKPAVSAIVIIVLSLFIIIIPLITAGVMVAKKVIFYAGHAPKLVKYLDGLLQNPVVIQFQSLTGFDFQNPELLQKVAGRIGEFATSLFTPLLSGTLNLFVGISIMYFILYYLLVNEKEIVKGIYYYLPFDQTTVQQMFSELENNVKTNVLGQSLIAFIQGSLVSIGFVIFNIPDAVFWGVISFFMAFIPVLGTPLIWVPAGLIAISQGNTFNGIGLIIYGAILVMNIDNLLRFLIAKQVGDIHPLITILGVIFGVNFFGILGLVIGPLLISYFLVLVEAYKREYTQP
ncbi:MAG: AI-2E family transporter [Cytophagales bacterium]|nr:AI-2E family transporter [Bernardetiaceae bacterium]MDW8205181.1 AI-2E family transporter [Cytophagales bacterium]